MSSARRRAKCPMTGVTDGNRAIARRGARRQHSGLAVILVAAAAVSVTAPLAAQEPARTRVVILGVGHSTQLVEERQQPAALRAFFDRVAPDAIGVERAPELLARGNHYEFTYEIQHVALPYALERRIPVHGIDWMPSGEDMLLGFGVDLETLPAVRSGWRGFLSFPDSVDVRLPLFFADSEEDRLRRTAPWLSEWEPASRDLPRRLYLYRTFLQARRIAEAAARYPGGTLLVPIGVNHKDDIERILADHPRIEIVQPSSFGEPSAEEVEEHLRRVDLFAIASFNLLGVQSTTDVVDWVWMGRVVQRLEAGGSSAETRLLATRLGVLKGEVSPALAIERYEEIAREAGHSVAFTWTGVQDETRIDSYFDPFGNLSVGDRAWLEAARELHRLRRARESDAIRNRLAGARSPEQVRQLQTYWATFIGAADNR
jgi:hypothetical protein